MDLLIKEVEKLEVKIELLELENRILKQTSSNVLDLDKTIDELNVCEVKALFDMLELTAEQGKAIFFK